MASKPASRPNSPNHTAGLPVAVEPEEEITEKISSVALSSSREEDEDGLKDKIRRLLLLKGTEPAAPTVKNVKPLWITLTPPLTPTRANREAKQEDMRKECKETTLKELHKAYEESKKLLEKQHEKMKHSLKEKDTRWRPAGPIEGKVELETLLGRVDTTKSDSANGAAPGGPQSGTEANERTLPSEANGSTLPSEANGSTLPPEANGRTLPSEGNGRTLPSEANGRTLPSEANGHTLPSTESDLQMESSIGFSIPDAGPTSSATALAVHVSLPKPADENVHEDENEAVLFSTDVSSSVADESTGGAADSASNAPIIQPIIRTVRRMGTITVHLPESLVMADCCIVPGTDTVHVSAMHKGIYIKLEDGKLKTFDRNKAGEFCETHTTSTGGCLIYTAFCDITKTWLLNLWKYTGQQWDAKPNQFEVPCQVIGQVVSACRVGKLMVAIAKKDGEYSLLSLSTSRSFKIKIKKSKKMSDSYGNPKQVVHDPSNKKLFILTETHLMNVKGFLENSKKVTVVWKQPIGAPNRLSMVDKKLYVTQLYSSRGLLFTPDGVCTGEVAVEGHTEVAVEGHTEVAVEGHTEVAVEGHTENSAQTGGRGDRGESSPLIALKVVQNKEGKPVMVCYRNATGM